MVIEIAIGVCVTTASMVAVWAARPLRELLRERWQTTHLSIYNIRGVVHIGAPDREDIQYASGEHAKANSLLNRLRRLVSRRSEAKKTLRRVRCANLMSERDK